MIVLHRLAQDAKDGAGARDNYDHVYDRAEPFSARGIARKQDSRERERTDLQNKSARLKGVGADRVPNFFPAGICLPQDNALQQGESNQGHQRIEQPHMPRQPLTREQAMNDPKHRKQQNAAFKQPFGPGFDGAVRNRG